MEKCSLYASLKKHFLATDEEHYRKSEQNKKQRTREPAVPSFSLPIYNTTKAKETLWEMGQRDCKA